MGNRIIKVIAIDDHEDNLITLKAIISEFFPDTQLFTATSGVQGLAIIKEENPDIILLDIVMPEMDGYAVCETIKADNFLCEIPVIFITANQSDRKSRMRVLEVGGDAFVSKPIDEIELVVQIRSMLKVREANLIRRNEKLSLANKVELQTYELNRTRIATLNMMEDLLEENKIKQKKESELAAINRTLSIHFQINELIHQSKIRDFIFKELCRILVETGKFRMAWIGIIDNSQHSFTPICWHGFEDGYISEYTKILSLTPPENREHVLSAIEKNQIWYSNDIASDDTMLPWREECRSRNYNSCATIPIRVNEQQICIFTLYHSQAKLFSSKQEILLHEKIKATINYAFDNILVEDERSKAENSLRKLSQAVEQSPVSIMITDTHGSIEYVNPKFLESSGYSLDEILGKNPRILKSGQTSPYEYKKLWEAIINEGQWAGELHNKRKNGQLYWESISISSMKNAEGHITNYLGVKEDITARKLAERELLQAKEQAEESDRLKSAFLANMSHEIRTPMNGILGFAELLKEPHLSGEEQQSYLEIIEKSGERMLNIINDIMNISKLESGQMEIVRTNNNINTLIQFIYTFFQQEATKKAIKLRLNSKLASSDEMLLTDKEKVFAILTNLVKNAIKFTETGMIEIGCQKKGKYIEFFVKDTGNGIPTEHLEFIFERFRQGSESLTRNYEGAGLGLAISKAYVEMLGGTIWVESKIGIGSTFYFTLPCNAQAEKIETLEPKIIDAPVAETVSLKKFKILIAEDDEISQVLLLKTIKNVAAEILIARNGVEAVEICRNNEDLDLILMDIKMPLLDGLGATKEIRQFNTKVIIIAQTAFALKGDREITLAAGCNEYISKPLKAELLIELINKHFNE